VHPATSQAVQGAQAILIRRMVSSRPALIAALFLIGGIVAALYIDIPLGAALALSASALLLSGVLFLFRAPYGLSLAALALFVVMLGLVRGTESIARNERRAVAEFVSEHSDASVCGCVVRMEEDRASRHRLLLSRAVLIAPEDTLRVTSLRLQVRGLLTFDTLRPGDWLSVEGTLRLPEDPRVPGQIGHVRNALMERIAAYVYVGDNTQCFVVPSKKSTPARIIHSLRRDITRALDSNLSDKASSLCKALFLGDRSGFSREFNQQIKATGLSHIFALSGLNVGLIASLVWLAASIFAVPFTLRIWLSLFATVFYVALGLGIPSLTRAGIMCSIFLVGHLIHRRAQVLNIIGAAAFLELLWRPLDLVDVGFQLSYLAVLGMVLTYTWLRAVAVKILGFDTLSRPSLRSILDVGLATLGAQIGTLPLLAAVFGTVPLVGLLANLVAVPAFALLLWWEIFLLALIPISHTVAASVGATINAFADFLHIFVEWFSALPGASLQTGYLSPLALAGIYLGLAVAWFQRERFQWKQASIGALIILNALVWPQVVQWRTARAEMYFLDVGNGDAILVRTPHGKSMLIDTGPAFGFWDASWRILPALENLGIDNLDALVLTHMEADHIGGAPAILRQFPVEKIYTNGIPRATVTYQALEDEIASGRFVVTSPKAGDLIADLDPYPVWVISPDSLWRMQSGNQNQTSLVLRVDFGKTSALFTADIDSATEQRLLPWKGFLHTHLLKVPHHGSKTSTSPAFLETVHPQLAVVTAGRHNPHGHPSDRVLQRLRALGIPYYITGEEGTVLVVSDGENLRRAPCRASTLARQWHLPTN